MLRQDYQCLPLIRYLLGLQEPSRGSESQGSVARSNSWYDLVSRIHIRFRMIDCLPRAQDDA